MKKLLAIILLLVSVEASANFEFLKPLKPYVIKFLGEDVANKIWKQPTLELPPIPKVVTDAKSTEVYKNRVVEKITFPEEQMQQYNIAFVEELVRATRQVEANNNDLGKWMGVLSQGATREGVYRALVLDTYYARLENYNDDVNENVINFSVNNLKKYTNKNIKKEKFQGLNVFTVKRIVTERMLEVMDAYLRLDKEQFYDWYAVYSAQLAADHPFWENKLRANKNPFVHKAWAKKVPFQFIKSEVIIKTHIALNRLQRIN